jgi:hypothetical protein
VDKLSLSDGTGSQKVDACDRVPRVSTAGIVTALAVDQLGLLVQDFAHAQK